MGYSRYRYVDLTSTEDDTIGRTYRFFNTISTKAMWLLLFLVALCSADEIWEQDLSEEFKIGISTTGYNSVDLKCTSTSFFVNVTVDADFEGVIYTRGDFSNKKKPCFQKVRDVTSINKETALFSFKIPFNKCHTVEDASDQQFTNILVIQHDTELIMPGDAAFLLACAFTPEQTLVGSTILAKSKSKISLVDADPGSTKISEEHQVESQTDSVSFPQKSHSPKDEL